MAWELPTIANVSVPEDQNPPREQNFRRSKQGITESEFTSTDVTSTTETIFNTANADDSVQNPGVDHNLNTSKSTIDSTTWGTYEKIMTAINQSIATFTGKFSSAQERALKNVSLNDIEVGQHNTSIDHEIDRPVDWQLAIGADNSDELNPLGQNVILPDTTDRAPKTDGTIQSTGTITFNFVDSSGGAVVAPAETVSGATGTTYTLTPPTVSGYTVDSTNTLTYTFTTTNQEVNITYTA